MQSVSTDYIDLDDLALTGSEAVLEHTTILLPQHPEYWNYRHVTSCMVLK